MNKGGKDAVVTPGTSMVYPYYDETGKLCAVILRNGKFTRVEMSPTEVIDHSLRYFGSSLRGAVDGAKMVFGMEISMSPVMVNERLSMYWFPSKSPSSDDCVWFALEHIYMYRAIDKKHTKVILRDGTIFTIHCSHSSFEQKHQRACMLKNQLMSRTREVEFNEQQNPVFYRISKDRKKRNYEISED